MDIKDINIRNLQMENIRLRNLLAERDALVKSMEHDKEAWAREARVGYISLDEHFAEMGDLRKDKDQRIAVVTSERDEERRLRLEAEARIHELEETAANSEEAHKEELAKFSEVQDMAEKAKANEIDMMSIVRVIQSRLFNHNSDRMRFLNSQLDIDDETVKEQGFEAILQAISQDADNELNGIKDNAVSEGQDKNDGNNGTPKGQEASWAIYILSRSAEVVWSGHLQPAGGGQGNRPQGKEGRMDDTTLLLQSCQSIYKGVQDRSVQRAEK